MKKLLGLSLMLLTLCGILQASEFDRLRMMEERGVQNADLYYNLGVTYWQIGQSGMANLYFLKALNLDSAHKLAKENLNYAISLSADRELYPPKPFLLRLFYEIYDFMNLNRIASLSLLLLLLTAATFSWLLHYDPSKERELPTLVFGISLFLLLSSVVFLSIKAYRRAHNPKAVLLQSEANLRSEADPEAQRVAVIHEAIIMDVLRDEGEWSLVRLPDGSSGWLKSDAIGRVIGP